MSVRYFYLKKTYLKQYKHNGPLKSYFDPFANWFKEYGYNELVARRHLTNIAHFNYYLSNNRESQKIFTEQDIQSFIHNHIPHCHCQYWGQIRDKSKVKTSIRRFQKYLAEWHGIDIRDEFSDYGDIYRDYLNWMKSKQYLSDSTIKINSNNLKKFLSWYKQISKNNQLSAIGAGEIERFLLKDFSPSRKSLRKTMQTTLRNFLSYCFECGITGTPLHSSVPAIKKYKLSELPKAIKDSEAIKLLQSIDRSKPGGKRLYAIIRLLFEYGVRGGQIRSLKIGDIDWHQEGIHFPALKGGKESVYPLSTEAGNALVDYIKNVRIKSMHEEVFLSLQAPFYPLKATTLSIMIKDAMKKANIETPHYGSHCFRHGFVTRLLKQNTSFKHIADCIGHRHIQSTFIYSKIDQDALAEVALELPEEIL